MESPVMWSEIRSSISIAKPAAPDWLTTASLPRRTSVSSPLSTDLPVRVGKSPGQSCQNGLDVRMRKAEW